MKNKRLLLNETQKYYKKIYKILIQENNKKSLKLKLNSLFKKIKIN